MVFSASYDEELNTSSFEQSQGGVFALEDAFGNPIDNPGAQPVDVSTNDSSLSDEVFLSQNFQFGMTYAGRRNNASLNYSNNRRSYDRGDGDETINSVTLSVSRSLSRSTSVDASTLWQLAEFGGDDDNETLVSFNLGLSHTVFRDVTGRLSYRHQRLSSDTSANEYTENRISADVSVRF